MKATHVTFECSLSKGGPCVQDPVAHCLKLGRGIRLCPDELGAMREADSKEKQFRDLRPFLRSHRPRGDGASQTARELPRRKEFPNGILQLSSTLPVEMRCPIVARLPRLLLCSCFPAQASVVQTRSRSPASLRFFFSSSSRVPQSFPGSRTGAASASAFGILCAVLNPMNRCD